MMNIGLSLTQLQGKTLKTLDQGNPFDVVSVTEQLVIVKPHISGKERPIRRTTVEEAFTEMVTRGEIYLTDIRDKSSDFSTAYIAAILAALPNVHVSKRPIRLEYKVKRTGNES